MTSDDRWTDMADIDAELERLLGGGSPPAEAPAWFGDVAVLVRTARAPARPDELAGEADIVARMVEVRLAVLAEAEAEGEAEADRPEADAGAAPAITRVNGVNGHAHSNGTSLGRDEPTHNGTSLGRDEPTHNGTSLGRDEPTHNGTNVGGDEDGRNGSSLGAYAAADDESDHGSLEDRLRERMAVSDLDEYRAKHAGERYYVAKHTAPPPEEPPHPVARTVGRVIAMKAVAVTTAAIIGVAAAAAATTGIVANVVVPAFNEHYRRPVVTSESPELKDEDEPGTSRSTRNPTTPGQIWACESTVLTPCVPPPLVSVTDPATGVPLLATTTTVPATTSTSVPDDATTSTTTSDTTGTTEPDPTTSTPTSVTVASEPPSP